MRPRWLGALVCACLTASCHAAAMLPTDDTLVVISSESPLPGNNPATIEEESSTAAPSSATEMLRLLEMEVKAEVSMRYSSTAVVTRVRNPSKASQETSFTMLLPDSAFITGFVMTLNGTSYKAYVKEKEEAKNIYEQAVSQGLSAAHVASSVRDSNHFTISVNVEPETTAIFNLTYEELLSRRNGFYNLAINLYPGGVVDRMRVLVHIKESAPLRALRVPELRTGNEIDANENDKQNTVATSIQYNSLSEATIVFEPSPNEQRDLMRIYKKKTDHYEGQRRKEKEEGELGQFVVQYDVTRQDDSQILVNDGYFVHFLAPPSLPPLPKHVVFVLDTSGSMSNRKIDQLRHAMRAILSDLNEGDYFSIVEFSSAVLVHDLKEADEEPVRMNYYEYMYEERQAPVRLVPPSRVTRTNIGKAKVIVGRLRAGGGTNIAKALDVAMSLVRRGHVWRTADANATHDDTTAAPEGINDTMEPIEPMIIFLTDGEANEGETDPQRIIKRVTERNSGTGGRNATIFALAFGKSADRGFLRKLSLRNAGFSRTIYEAADAELQLQDFYRQVSAPQLSGVSFQYPPDQVVEGSVTKSKFRTHYGGSETVVAGRVAAAAAALHARVDAFCGTTDLMNKMNYTKITEVPIAKNSSGFQPLERLWAYLTVRQLLDESDAQADPDLYVTDEDNNNTAKKRALKIALKYSFVTPLTSLVVVKPNSTKAVDLQSTDENNEFENAKIPMSAFLSRPLHQVSYDSVSAAGYFSSGPFSLSAMQAPPLPALEEDVYDDEALTLSQSAPQIISSAGEFDTVATSTRSPLAEYQLEEFPWLRPLIDAAAGLLRIDLNGTQLTLKLARDNSVVGNVTSAACPVSAGGGGGGGACVYLPRCAPARTISAADYANTYCTIGDGYAGICCPQSGILQL